jgi:hypothetical protein
MSFVLKLGLPLLFLFSAAHGQESADPYFLLGKTYTDAQLRDVWRRLGIDSEFHNPGFRGEGYPAECEDACEIVRIGPIQAGHGEDLVLEVMGLRYFMTRFLIFHQNDAGWKFVDYLDSGESRYDRAKLEVIDSEGKRWFVLTVDPQAGTGINLIHSDWHEIRAGKLHRVLSVPSGGHDINYDPNRSFSTRFVRSQLDNGKETLRFIYYVEFTSPSGEPLWFEEKFVGFSRPAGMGEFLFDSRNSELSKEYAEKVFAFDTLDGRQLLEFNRPHLLDIARGGDSTRKMWLEEQLSDPEMKGFQDIREILRVKK